MPHQKRHQIIDDLLKYWPLISVLVASIAVYATLNGTVNAYGRDIDKIKDTQGKMWASSTEQRVAQAKIEAQVDYIYQAIKDAKKNQ